MFGTLQDRLPKEFKLAGIDSPEAANRFLADHNHNRSNHVLQKAVKLISYRQAPSEPPGAAETGREARSC
jgi:hypothetical protein